MFFTIYKITNQINGKYYIGKHQTKNLDDGYMGSGELIKRAINKYGLNNFKKEILHIFDNEADMNAKEQELVLINENTYNLAPGGVGVNSELARKGREAANRKLKEKFGDDWHKIISELGSAKGSKVYRDKWENDPEFRANILANSQKGRLIALSDTARHKRKETMSKNNHQQGEKNSQYGTCWVTNGIENKKIKYDQLESYLQSGWYKGRTVPSSASRDT